MPQRRQDLCELCLLCVLAISIPLFPIPSTLHFPFFTSHSGISLAERPGMRISCVLFGHDMNNHRFLKTKPSRPCICGKPILCGNSATRIRHILSCFLAGHTYRSVGQRDGHQEYMCLRCGHPLLFLVSTPFSQQPVFKKKVRYLCNLLGHDVHSVTERDSYYEYACFCGHTFLKTNGNARKITHPLICLVAGHFVERIAIRSGLSEFACKNCGHTFLVGAPDGE